MDTQSLLGYIRRPESLKTADLEELKILAEKYPYAQFSHLLYLKALYEQQNPLYPEQLKQTAAYLPDRSILYYLIGEHTASSGSPSHPLDRLTDRLKKLVTITGPGLDTIIRRIKKIEQKHETRVQEIVRAFVEERNTPKTKQNVIEEIIEDEKGQTELIDKEETQLEEVLTNEAENIEVDIDNPQKDKIIERFIEQNPGITRAKPDFFNPLNMAQESSEDNEEIVSETLAEVHLKQGYFLKALKIYQRLYLIIPEKSAYFAARIEKIKQEHKLV